MVKKIGKKKSILCCPPSLTWARTALSFLQDTVPFEGCSVAASFFRLLLFIIAMLLMLLALIQLLTPFRRPYFDLYHQGLHVSNETFCKPMNSMALFFRRNTISFESYPIVTNCIYYPPVINQTQIRFKLLYWLGYNQRQCRPSLQFLM